jgi:hypothetical protein
MAFKELGFATNKTLVTKKTPDGRRIRGQNHQTTGCKHCTSFNMQVTKKCVGLESSWVLRTASLNLDHYNIDSEGFQTPCLGQHIASKVNFVVM